MNYIAKRWIENCRKDAKITPRMNYDLLKKIDAIEKNAALCPELLGPCTTSKTTETIPPAVAKAENCRAPDC